MSSPHPAFKNILPESPSERLAFFQELHRLELISQDQFRKLCMDHCGHDVPWDSCTDEGCMVLQVHSQ